MFLLNRFPRKIVCYNREAADWDTETRNPGEERMVFLMVCISAFCLVSGQVRDGNKDLPAPTFGHLTRLENELKPEERRYLREVSGRFNGLWEHFAEAEKQRRKLLSADPSTDSVVQVSEAYRTALSRVEKSAVGLRYRLTDLLRGEQQGKDLPPIPDSDRNKDRFRAEMNFIKDNIREAEYRFLKRYMQGLALTEGENLLIRLDWVARVAHQVRDALGG